MLSARYIPNIITGARIACVPFFVWLLFHHQYERSLILVFLMGLSDGLDGFLARCYNWKTTLGAYLDPLADKIMLLTAFVSFAVLGWIPWWLAGIVVARDVVLLIGAVAYHIGTRQLKMEPLAISKVNTFMQIVFAVSLIYSQVWPIHEHIMTVLMALVACTTLASGSQYIVEWSWRAAKITQKQA